MSSSTVSNPPTFNNASSVYENLATSKVDTLRDDPPLSGQKWCCVSMVSPESRQKGQVYAWKLRFVSETPEEAEKMAEHLRNNDPTFDVYVTRVGVWVPWVWSPDQVQNAQYMNSQLTELVAQQCKQRELADAAFDERVQRELEEIRRNNTKEGQAERLAEKEKPVSVYFKILQLQRLLESRKSELDDLVELFESEMYTDAERQHAREHPYPEIKIAPSAFQHVRENDQESQNGQDLIDTGDDKVEPELVTDDKGKRKPRIGFKRLFK